MSDYDRKLRAALMHMTQHILYLESVVYNSNIIHDRMRWDPALAIPPIPEPNVAPTSAGTDSPSPVSPGGGASPDDDGPRYVPWHCPADCECRAVAASGPPGAAAAKESPDNAAAPEGAALHDVERECNCEQAVELLRRLEQFRAELDKTRIESAERQRKLREIETETEIWYDSKKSARAAVEAIIAIIGK